MLSALQQCNTTELHWLSQTLLFSIRPIIPTLSTSSGRGRCLLLCSHQIGSLTTKTTPLRSPSSHYLNMIRWHMFIIGEISLNNFLRDLTQQIVTDQQIIYSTVLKTRKNLRSQNIIASGYNCIGSTGAPSLFLAVLHHLTVNKMKHSSARIVQLTSIGKLKSSRDSIDKWSSS